MKQAFSTVIIFLMSIVLVAQGSDFEEKLSDESTSEDSLKHIYKYLSNFSIQGDFEEQKNNFQKIEFSLLGVDNDTLNALFFTKRAAFYRQGGSVNKAITYYLKAENIYLDLKQDDKLSAILFNHSKAHTSKYEFEKAINLCEESLEIAKQLVDKSSQARAYNQIGINYDYQDKFDEAILYYQKALTLYLELENKLGMANAYNNLGVMYDLKGDLDQALNYYNRSLLIEKELGNKQGIAGSKVNLGLIYQAKKEWVESEKSFKDAGELYKSIDDNLGLSVCFVNLADFYKEKKDYKLAIYYAQKSIKLAKELGDVRQLIENHEKIISIYKAVEDFEKLSIYQNDLMYLKDSVFNAVKESDRLSLDEKINKLTISNEGLKSNNDTLKSENSSLSKMNQKNIVFGILSLLILIGLMIYFRAIKK